VLCCRTMPSCGGDSERPMHSRPQGVGRVVAVIIYVTACYTVELLEPHGGVALWTGAPTNEMNVSQVTNASAKHAMLAAKVNLRLKQAIDPVRESFCTMFRCAAALIYIRTDRAHLAGLALQQRRGLRGRTDAHEVACAATTLEPEFLPGARGHRNLWSRAATDAGIAKNKSILSCKKRGQPLTGIKH
jgi:hypothetical protein